MKNVLNYIKSLDFAFVLCIMSMLGQSFHTFYSFYAVSNIDSDWFRIPEALILVFVFECFTLFYLMRGRTGLASFYSCCLFVMNVYYYIDSGSSGKELYLGIFLSAIIPISVYFVSEEVKQEYINSFKKKDKVKELLNELETKGV